MVRDKNVVGISETKATAAEVDSTKNEMSRVGRFSPSQWALGRLPRVPGSQFDEEEAFDFGVLANLAESGSGEFFRQASFRAGARKAFAERGVGGRAARAMHINSPCSSVSVRGTTATTDRASGKQSH